jgi:hypothetical protein
MKRKWIAISGLAVLLGMTCSAGAAVYNFATFNETSGSRPFSFTNNTTSASLGYNSNVPVEFDFTTPTGLSTADRAGTLTISTNTSTSPATTNGPLVDELISSTTLQIIENSTGKNLLTMTFTGTLDGPSGGPSAQITGADTNSNAVTFSSDYLTFTTPGDSYALSLASITPVLSIGPGGFLNTFVADLSGSFSANAAPVPEPTAIGACIVAGTLLVRRRR